MVDFGGSKNLAYLHHAYGKRVCLEGALRQRTNQPAPVRVRHEKGRMLLGDALD